MTTAERERYAQMEQVRQQRLAVELQGAPWVSLSQFSALAVRVAALEVIVAGASGGVDREQQGHGA